MFYLGYLQTKLRNFWCLIPAAPSCAWSTRSSADAVWHQINSERN